MAQFSGAPAVAQVPDYEVLNIVYPGSCDGTPGDIISVAFDLGLPSEFGFLAGPNFLWTADAVHLREGWTGRAGTTVLRLQSTGVDIAIGRVGPTLRHQLTLQRSRLCDMQNPFELQYRLRDKANNLIAELRGRITLGDSPLTVKLLNRERFLHRLDDLFGPIVAKYLGPSISWFQEREADRDAGRSPSTDKPTDLCYLCSGEDDAQIEVALAQLRASIDPSYLMLTRHAFSEWKGSVVFLNDDIVLSVPAEGKPEAAVTFRWIRSARSEVQPGLYLASIWLPGDSYRRSFSAFVTQPDFTFGSSNHLQPSAELNSSRSLHR